MSFADLDGRWNRAAELKITKEDGRQLEKKASWRVPEVVPTIDALHRMPEPGN